MQQHQTEGIVISSTGSWYEVATATERLNCRIRGRLRLKGIRSTNPVVVGEQSVTMSSAWSMFAAMICDSFERFEARRMM